MSKIMKITEDEVKILHNEEVITISKKNLNFEPKINMEVKVYKDGETFLIEKVSMFTDDEVYIDAGDKIKGIFFFVSGIIFLIVFIGIIFILMGLYFYFRKVEYTFTNKGIKRFHKFWIFTSEHINNFANIEEYDIEVSNYLIVFNKIKSIQVKYEINRKSIVTGTHQEHYRYRISIDKASQFVESIDSLMNRLRNK